MSGRNPGPTLPFSSPATLLDSPCLSLATPFLPQGLCNPLSPALIPASLSGVAAKKEIPPVLGMGSSTIQQAFAE